MKINFKFLIFCLIAVFLIASYHTGAKASPISKPHQATTITAPVAGGSYTIRQLFELINTNNPALSSNFICMNPDPNQVQTMPNTSTLIKSFGANQVGFSSAWAQKNNTTVILQQDLAQIQRLINGGALPSQAQVNALKGKPAYALAQQLVNNFPKILLYFTAVSPTNGHTYNLYLIDPCPGITRWNMIKSGQLKIEATCPAYVNVLSKWNIQ